MPQGAKSFIRPILKSKIIAMSLPEKEILSKWVYTCLLQKLKYSTNNVQDKVQQQRNNHKVKLSPSKQLYEHVCSVNPKVADLIPRTYYKYTSNSHQSIYLFDDACAKHFASLISGDLLSNKCFVAQLGTEMVLLTAALLEAGIPTIHVYEHRKRFIKSLSLLQEQYPNRVILRELNILNTSKIWWLHRDKNRKQLDEIYEGVTHKKWEEEPAIHLIGIITSIPSISSIILSVALQTGFMSFGRTVLYLAVPPSLWEALTYIGRKRSLYSPKSVLLHVLFDFKVLGTLDRKAFLPLLKKPELKIRTTRSTMKLNDHEMFYVVKLEPKANLLEEFRDLPTGMVGFWYFLRHNMSGLHRVIPNLEKVVPGCGIKLIAKDYNIYTEFHELDPVALYELYKEFISWPETEKSSFVISLKEQFVNVDLSISPEIVKMYSHW